MQKAQRRAIVIGGSISGLFAALILIRRGWTVDVFERTPGELEGRGAGVVAQPELRAALAQAGIGDIGQVGIEITSRLLLDPTGQEVMRHPCPQTVCSWERVRGLLRSHLPAGRYHAACELKQIDIEGRTAVAVMADGNRHSAELIIGADGNRSTVRQQFFPEARLEYAGYVAWRSLVDEVAFTPALHKQLFWQMSFGLPPGEQFIGYPVTGPNDDMTPGNLRYNFLWYRPAREGSELTRLLTDDTGRMHTYSIPPPLVRGQVREEMRTAAALHLAPQFREVIAMSPQPFLQPIYDLESRRLAAGPVAIIGDAAFLARPHVAAGIIKAADDMLSMAAALDGEPDVESALRRYEAERVAVGRRILHRARAMGANYAKGAHGQSSADVAYARAVLADTALTTFLREPG